MRKTFTAIIVSFLAAFPLMAQDGLREVEIENLTGQDIVEFYASNVETDSWEEDIFDGFLLKDGQTVTVDFDDGTGHCMFDLKSVLLDKSEVHYYYINVCTTAELRIYK